LSSRKSGIGLWRKGKMKAAHENNCLSINQLVAESKLVVAGGIEPPTKGL
jgi:hypothetical protein